MMKGGIPYFDIRYSLFDIRYSLFQSFFFDQLAVSAVGDWADKGLLFLLSGLVALLVGIIVSLLLGLLVMIVEITAGYAGDRAHSQSDPSVTRDRPNNPTGCSADGSATQRPLFGIRHPCAASKRQAGHEQYNNQILLHDVLLSTTRS
jgi:hypothetical protein